MGSIDAMKAGSKDRYFQGEEQNVNKLVPEGIVGRVPFKGSLSETVYQLVGGIKAGMGYCGAPTIPDLQKAKFVQQPTLADYEASNEESRGLAAEFLKLK